MVLAHVRGVQTTVRATDYTIVDNSRAGNNIDIYYSDTHYSI